ncbi:MAG: hypothetical protein P3T54_00010 [Dehalogenimonas sp.]|nr:hypothetical protein [Dehalogenimonas sp.]
MEIVGSNPIGVAILSPRFRFTECVLNYQIPAVNLNPFNELRQGKLQLRIRLVKHKVYFGDHFIYFSIGHRGEKRFLPLHPLQFLDIALQLPLPAFTFIHWFDQ